MQWKESYLKWDTKIIKDFSEKNINSLYNKGYVFARVGKGAIYQTRSIRININKFKLSSENKRILKKTENISMNTTTIPYHNYHWSIHKMGKDFYATKFGDKTFSANKIKELMTDSDKSNFNLIFIYSENENKQGYCIAYETEKMVHYSYPFYNTETKNKNIGMGMMLKAIQYAKKNNKEYIYLGSATRPTDTYKLQFAGLEWFDKEKWNTNLDELKNILKNI